MKNHRLTEVAQADRDQFNSEYDGGNCSCHNSPPCGSCTHPGNPHNQEDAECWEPDETAPAAAHDFDIMKSIRDMVAP